MSKISAYGTATPGLSDLLLGDLASGPSTAKFTVQTVLNLLAGGTTLSANLLSVTGTNAAGGTYYYINLGGIKLLFGSTGTFTNGGTLSVTFPNSFFTSPPYYSSASMYVPTINSVQSVYVSATPSSTTANITVGNNSGNSSATTAATYLFIGV